VIGPRHRLDAEALLGLAQLDIALYADDVPVADGSGRDVVGGPVSAIASLLADRHAPVLAAGSLVSTGALTGGAHPVTTGSTWRITSLAGELTEVQVRWDG
jgi:2-keto-4-pentenoate hydratase